MSRGLIGALAVATLPSVAWWIGLLWASTVSWTAVGAWLLALGAIAVGLAVAARVRVPRQDPGLVASAGTGPPDPDGYAG